MQSISGLMCGRSTNRPKMAIAENETKKNHILAFDFYEADAEAADNCT